MTKERLEEIHDSIEFQMQLQQAVGYKSRYDDLLIEEIDLYNEVIDLQEKIDKAIEVIEKSYYSKNTTDIDSIVVSNNKLLQVRNILKGESNNENNK